ncbi:hypothetical protein FACS189485_09730 [Spirochaetia bacterium]|nr:hypothetical protein FACS189485_09730 [Spirochaetia bacterium]
MHNIVIFCKTYSGDIERLVILKKSIDRFNVEKIPFYISCPQKDRLLLETRTVTGKEEYELRFVTDEQILSLDTDYEQSWYTQQIIKLSFYKLNICNFYINIDSDAYFIKDFFISDFMFNETVPYTIMKRCRGGGHLL